MQLYCTTFGTLARPRRVTPGSTILTIVLLFCYVAPGLLYLIWRVTHRRQVCRACGSGAIVPPTTPVAAAALAANPPPPTLLDRFDAAGDRAAQRIMDKAKSLVSRSGGST